MPKPLKNNFLLLLTASIVVVVSLNLLLVYVEAGAEGSSITNFWKALWFMVITITTVGYGDMYPITVEGKIIGTIFVFASLGVLGLLISRVSTNYQKMMEEKKLGYKGTDFEGHVIIIGWNDFSKMVAEEIYHSAQDMVIVTNVKDDIDLIYNYFDKSNTFVLFTDFDNYEMLELANVSKAASVFISFEDDTKTLVYVIDFKKKYGGIPIVTTIEKPRLLDTFKTAGVSHVVSKNEISSRLVASYMFEPDVADLNNDILSSARHDTDYDIQEYFVTAKNPYCNMDYLSAFVAMKKDFDTVLLGLTKVDNGSRTLLKNPSEGVVIKEGDYMLIMCMGQMKEKLTSAFGVNEGIRQA